MSDLWKKIPWSKVLAVLQAAALAGLGAWTGVQPANTKDREQKLYEQVVDLQAQVKALYIVLATSATRAVPTADLDGDGLPDHLAAPAALPAPTRVAAASPHLLPAPAALRPARIAPPPPVAATADAPAPVTETATGVGDWSAPAKPVYPTVPADVKAKIDAVYKAEKQQAKSYESFIAE